ncbi:uncharacterized protein LACBIDRAFT_333841 [Laccaria bicolor S238N-H82]|uniref:Predicted protein n=1 Tax=Laccaria bicolor (strain S238N-H82 / ATCC MYA-4686) TaxID=486041 RepID=B0DX92_LACBS|nr:uncharacterized protein LACBIDRAFT_333841 [Laccaria bicolor S238N-H82]EDR00751.1 predicted protein [Laccaria bicolor S238N-H82]|eukprot:XP_001888543.1 predicted protein [Laccaria bicolor S238N-H82]
MDIRSTSDLCIETPVIRVDTVGYYDALADYITKRKSRSDEAPAVNPAATSDSTAHTATPTTTLTSRQGASQPLYSFPKSSRAPKPNSKTQSQPSSQSVLPAKTSTTSSHRPPKTTNIPKSTATSSSTTSTTKPSSPLTAFQFTAQTSRPTTSNVTVSATGVVDNSSSPSSTTSTLRKSTTDDPARYLATTSSTEPVVNSPGFDTIIEGQEMETPVITRGGTSTYKDSPMAKLIAQYSGEDENDELSTESWVNILITKDELEAELVEKVEDPNKGITKYKLSDDFLEGLIKISTELQIFVEKAAGLIEEWTQHFVVDPGDTLIPILRGTTSLPQLNVAWTTIQRRLELGNRTLNKYMQQYQNDPQMEFPLSPVSTLPKLHSDLSTLQTADQRLRYLYQKFPNHHEQLSEQAETALNQGKSWMNILPLPTTWKKAFIPDKEQLPGTSNRQASKGKQRETRESADEDENDAASRIWLGAETPFKGPNKWFDGGRLKTRALQSPIFGYL